MSRPVIVFTIVAGFLGGLIGAAMVWSLQHGLFSGAAAKGYLDTIQSDTPAMTPGLIVFLLFALYWSWAATNRAADASVEPRWSTALHRGLLLVAAIAIMIPLPGLAARFAPKAFGAWFMAAGLVVELGGVVLAVLARRALGRNWSAEVRIAEGHQLIRTGVYRRLRHPIYTGVLLIYLGLALQGERLSGLVGFALATAAYWRKIGLEERILEQTFGADFDAWRKASWALIPRPF